MGEVSLNSANLLAGIASLYDNHLFSDVELIFIAENGVSERMFCHSLILAIRSEKFARMFFGDSKKEATHKVEVPCTKKSSFIQLIRFLYTDNLQLHTFEEAQELYDLAAEYIVKELKERCLNYILNGKLNIENLFLKYEYALSKGMHILLKECRNFVCSNSQLILQSDEFTNASRDVVEDIVKLDNLSVSTELEVIGAILKWGSEELKRQELSLDEKNLRKCISPLKKHVRFLTLSRAEFDYLIDRYDIFSSKECCKLAQKMIDPGVVLPDSLSSINAKRTCVALPQNASSDLSVNETINSLNINNDTEHTITPSNDSPFSRSLKSSNSEVFLKSPDSGASDIKKLPASDTNKVSFQIKKILPFDERRNLSSSLKDSSPVAPKVNSRLRDYEFSLQESAPCFRTSFENDVKSSVTFHMVTGNILLYGFEVKVENKLDTLEDLAVDVDLKGFSKQSFSELYKEKLRNNIIFIKLPENMVLQAGSKGTLEVSIDNLLLNRCCTCNSNKPLELNCGNSFACEMTLNSTQKTETGFLFLVSKLIYLPC